MVELQMDINANLREMRQLLRKMTLPKILPAVGTQEACARPLSEAVQQEEIRVKKQHYSSVPSSIQKEQTAYRRRSQREAGERHMSKPDSNFSMKSITEDSGYQTAKKRREALEKKRQEYFRQKTSYQGEPQ